MAERMYARTNAEGTACAETARCPEHLPCPPADASYGDGPYGEPVDCSDNEALQCTECGARTA